PALAFSQIYTLSLHDALPISEALLHEFSDQMPKGLDLTPLLPLRCDPHFSLSPLRFQLENPANSSTSTHVRPCKPIFLGSTLSRDRKSTRLNSSHVASSYAVF